MAELIKENKMFGGFVKRYRHDSKVLSCPMHFTIFVPPGCTEGEKAPVSSSTLYHPHPRSCLPPAHPLSSFQTTDHLLPQWLNMHRRKLHAEIQCST